jgi:hypothetical protein
MQSAVPFWRLPSWDLNQTTSVFLLGGCVRAKKEVQQMTDECRSGMLNADVWFVKSSLIWSGLFQQLIHSSPFFIFL